MRSCNGPSSVGGLARADRWQLVTAYSAKDQWPAAKREIAMAKGSRAFDHMVINDNLERAVAEIRKLISNKKAGAL